MREHTDLVALVGRYVALKRRGSNFVGLCPFHQEKTPSFNVSPDRGMFRCFGCNTYGDAFRFLMLVDGLSFVEAVRELAGPAGITVEERELSPEEVRGLKKRATLFDVLEAACAFFESVLWTRPEGEPGRAYLDRRGLERDVARQARLGYAPDGWTRLIDHLHRAGFPPELIAEAGLAKERRAGDGHYDLLRERIIFPIHDERSRPIAFGGRLLVGDGPKYLNTPETRLYQKSNVLYAFDIARSAIQRRDRALLVEGYFDVLSLRQAGFPEAVATCGTALTAAHLERLRRLTHNVVVLTDADEAGQQAAERSLPLFLGAHVQPWRVDIPGAKDPDEYVQTHGSEAMELLIAQRQPLVEWVVSRRLSQYSRSTAMGGDVDAMSRERVVEELLPLLLLLPDAVVSRVSARLGVREEVLRARLVESSRAGVAPAAAVQTELAPDGGHVGWKAHVDVVHLLWLLIHRYDRVADLLQEAGPEVLDHHPLVRPVIARLLSGEPVAAVQHDAADPGVSRALAAIAARDVLYEPDEAPLALCHLLDRLDKPRRRSLRARLTEEVDAALARGDFERYRVVAQARAGLVEHEHALDRALTANRPDEFVRRLREAYHGSVA